MEIDDYIVATDQQLIEWVLGGDHSAFEYLFNRYRDGVHQLYVQRTGGNADDANDLLQETFVKVYLKLDRYDDRYTFGQWIYTIARNTFIDYIRKRRDDLPIDTLPRENPSVTPTPEESFINRQQRAQLDQYMKMMPARYHRLVELRFFREFSYEEIAAELSLPLGTVKTQIHRAREMLCRFINESSDF